MSRAIILAAVTCLAAACLVITGTLSASAQQVPCNPAVEFCLPIPPETGPPEKDD